MISSPTIIYSFNRRGGYYPPYMFEDFIKFNIHIDLLNKI